eukprot:Rhum_TRINITY_DN15316_c1_g1::Rhum_TRINITY_DN15316_c1_g1_i8::g.151075::m.151075
MGRPIGIPILAVITVATVLSSAASLGGGLMMYFEGLRSLRESVKTTSASEVQLLESEVLGVFKRTVNYGSTVKTFLWSTERLPPGTDSQEAADIARVLFHSEVVHSNGLLYYIAYGGILPGEPQQKNNTYTVVWGDVRRDGVRELVFGEYGPYLPNMTRVQNPHNPLKYDVLAALAYPLDTKSGVKKSFAYAWNWGTNLPAYVNLTASINGGSVTLPAEPRGWIDPAATVEDAFGATWYGPSRFPASDGFVSAYMTLFLALPAPPPPHPWSKFRYFPLVTGFLTQSLSTPFVEYKKGQPDAHAMLIERSPKGNYVYASTTGAQIVPERCQGANYTESLALSGKDGCHLQLSDMSLELQDAYAYLADKAFGDFHTTSLNGAAHFLRRQAVVHDWEIVWIKSTAAVDSEVQKALRLLIMFTLLVLLFDLVIAVSEVFFIALPLAAVARTVGHVGEMRIEQASCVLHEMLQRRVMLREMVTVVSGLMEATQRLEEFRTFMPTAVLGKDDGSSSSGEDPSTPQSRSPSSGGRTSVRSAPKSSGKNSCSSISSRTDLHAEATRQAVSLALHVVSRNIGVLLVNCVGWARSGDMSDPARLVASHEKLVEHVMGVCSGRKGLLDSFSGDRILMAWNAAQRCADTAARLASSALAVSAYKTMKLSSAFTYGRGFCGTLGTSTLRRFSIVSDLVPRVHMLEGLNKARGWRTTTDETLLPRLRGRVSYRVMDGLMCESTGRVLAVAEVLEELKTENEEWMYQLEGGNKATELINETVQHVVHESWDAVESLPQLPSSLEHVVRAYNLRSFKPMALRLARVD